MIVPRQAPTTGTIGPMVVATAAIALLAVRPALLSLQPSARTLASALILSGIAAASWSVRVPAPRRRMRPALVIGIGLLAVALSTWALGPAPGLPVPGSTVVLAILAAIAEELLFRRLAYGALARWSEGLALASTAVAFALLHLPLYGPAALPLDLGAGLLLSWQRWAAGSWTAPAATHVAANLLAVLR